MRPESSYIVKSSGYALFIRRVYLLGYFIYVLFIASVSDECCSRRRSWQDLKQKIVTNHLAIIIIIIIFVVVVVGSYQVGSCCYYCCCLRLAPLLFIYLIILVSPVKDTRK